jgi:hypothetical protein
VGKQGRDAALLKYDAGRMPALRLALGRTFPLAQPMVAANPHLQRGCVHESSIEWLLFRGGFLSLSFRWPEGLRVSGMDGHASSVFGWGLEGMVRWYAFACCLPSRFSI